MRAGRPMLVVPYSHDQPDRANRLQRLGIARSIPRQKYTAARAMQEIEVLLQHRTYAERAAEVGTRIRHEAGVTTACDLLERLIDGG